jgi:hypothetical protein
MFRKIIFTLLILIILSLISSPVIFDYRLSSQTTSLTEGQPHCFLVTDNSSFKSARLTTVSPEKVNFFKIVSNHLFFNVYGKLYETAPHLILITNEKAWLWSMKNMRFEEYVPGYYVELNYMDKAAVISGK